jgi:type IV pilus assembly protein PilZ
MTARRLNTAGESVAGTRDRRGSSLPPLGADDAPSSAAASSDVDPDRRSGAERRQWERVLVDLQVDYRAEDTFLFAYITDISAMGIFVQTHEPETPGTRLNLRFSVPGQKIDFELEGEVIWINPYRPGDRENLNPGMGIRFIDLQPADRERLTELVKTFAYLHDDRSDPDDVLGELEDDLEGDATLVQGAPGASGDDAAASDDDELDATGVDLDTGRRPGRA